MLLNLQYLRCLLLQWRLQKKGVFKGKGCTFCINENDVARRVTSFCQLKHVNGCLAVKITVTWVTYGTDCRCLVLQRVL